MFKSIDQLVENYKIKDKIGPVAEQSNSSGYLVSEGLDGRLFTILSYVEEFFPYDNTVSVHFYTPYKKNSFYSTKSTLISFFLVSSLSGCKKIISRHTSKEIHPLLMLISLNFQICELASQSEKMVVLEKQFNTVFLDESELKTDYKINKIYNSYRDKRPSKQNNKNFLLNLEQKIILNQWLGYKRSEGIFEIGTIKERLSSQKQILLDEVISPLGETYIFVNKETRCSLILIPLNLKNRIFFYNLYLKIKKNKRVNTIYIIENNNFLRSIMHLSGFRYIGNTATENGFHLHKWEKS